MITHFIFMSSSYSLGTRIALDYIATEDKLQAIQENLSEDLSKIIEECGKDVSISTHIIQADDESWDAVCKADYFFKDVNVIDELNEFIKLIKKDRVLDGTDIAKYILTKFKCTQLKLQKLVYFCFAEYLCDTGEKLFEEDIYAFRYGPVIKSVYKRYKKYGYKDIDKEVEDINLDSIYEMPAKSRILFAEDGTQKILSIDKTLKLYGNLTAGELVDLTHRKNTPWSRTKNLFSYTPIKIDTIKEYHKYETI